MIITDNSIGVELCPIVAPRDFDQLILELGKSMVHEIKNRGVEPRRRVCEEGEVVDHLYPPHAEKLGRTATVASRFEPITDDLAPDRYGAMLRQPLNPWGSGLVLGKSFVAYALYGADSALLVNVSVGVHPTRLAGQSSLILAPSKNIGKLDIVPANELQQHLDRRTIPH